MDFNDFSVAHEDLSDTSLEIVVQDAKTLRFYSLMDTIGRITLILVVMFLIVKTNHWYPMVMMLFLFGFNSQRRLGLTVNQAGEKNDGR